MVCWRLAPAFPAPQLPLHLISLHSLSPVCLDTMKFPTVSKTQARQLVRANTLPVFTASILSLISTSFRRRKQRTKSIAGGPQTAVRRKAAVDRAHKITSARPTSIRAAKAVDQEGTAYLAPKEGSWGLSKKSFMTNGGNWRKELYIYGVLDTPRIYIIPKTYNTSTLSSLAYPKR